MQHERVQCSLWVCQTKDGCTLKHVKNIDLGPEVVTEIRYNHLPDPTVTGIGHQNVICEEHVPMISSYQVTNKATGATVYRTYTDKFFIYEDYDPKVSPPPTIEIPPPPPGNEPTAFTPLLRIQYEDKRDELGDLYMWLFIGVIGSAMLYGIVLSVRHCRGATRRAPPLWRQCTW